MSYKARLVAKLRHDADRAFSDLMSEWLARGVGLMAGSRHSVGALDVSTDLGIINDLKAALEELAELEGTEGGWWGKELGRNGDRALTYASIHSLKRVTGRTTDGWSIPL